MVNPGYTPHAWTLRRHEDTQRRQGQADAGKRHQEKSNQEKVVAKPGLYSNIAAKRKRIAAGSGESMRKPGTKGAPTASAFKAAAKTAKKPKKK